MKFSNKYVFPPFLTLFFFLLGGAIILIVDLVVPMVYDYLCHILPDLFYRPNVIDEPEKYRETQKWLSIVTITITAFIATVFSMRMDNKRFEYLTTLTEGLYTIPSTTVWYIKSFYVSDIISSVISPLILTLPAYLVPMQYIATLLPVFWCGGRLISYVGVVEATFITVGISLVLRFILIPSTLNAWRSAWLSGSVD